MSAAALAPPTPPHAPPHAPPLVVAPAEAARLAGVGRTTLYAALKSGALPSLKLGRRRLIKIGALQDWLDAHGA
jgi:excisionase family DNA binding protein